MRNRLLFALAFLGVFLAVASAFLFSRRPPAQKPVFAPTTNPYPQGIFANGIIESYQANGSNVNIYPEVSGPVTRVLVKEGDTVHCGDLLLTIDDSVQRATAAQQQAQAEAAHAMLNALKAQPRPETLEVSMAQLSSAQATLRSVRDNLAKMEDAYRMSPGTVSLDQVDNARNAVRVAEANLVVARRQLDLTKAGAWSYDVRIQERQYAALDKAHAASLALLAKYSVRAPADGVVLSVNVPVGGYVSPQGVYDTYTTGFGPAVVMGTPQDRLAVRCYVDEILVPRLPPDPTRISARMTVRGSGRSVPLTFDRLQPYVSPKVELTNQRLERVDVRVLPIIFRFDKPKDLNLFPGQVVDVYISQR